MGFFRTVSILTGFGVLCSVSIYWTYLQQEIGGTFYTEQQIKISPKHLSLNDLKIFAQNHSSRIISSRCKNCTTGFSTDIIRENDTTSKDIVKRKRQIWISMGLCFSKNTNLYGKKKYPYAQVTPLAIILWYHFFPDIRVILYLVYDEKEIEDRRILYEEQLKQTNVEVRWVPANDINCITKSQLIRLWAFQEPLINENDIIVTVDVNLFVTTKKILDPIYQNPDMSIWVFQWHNTAFGKDGIGDTFNQNLISAESKVWRQIVDQKNETTLNQKWLSERIDEIGLARTKYNEKWYYDQWITTYGILKHKFCTVPEESGLWKIPGLVDNSIYFPNMNDSTICWHGKNYQDCNKDIRIVAYGCKWWHFFPFEKLKDHVKKFQEITENAYKLDFEHIFTNDTWKRLHPR